MKMKKIIAETMKDAMELARRELGENAVLIDNKKAANGQGIIVTFAIDEPDEMLFDDSPAAPNYANILPFSPDIAKPTISKVELAHPAYEMIRDAM
ncbi:MAG: hypothetical protein ACOYNL_11360 [Rickettsiales bacterium]